MGTEYRAINKSQKRYVELGRLEKTVYCAALLYAFTVNDYDFGEISIVEDDYLDSCEWQSWTDAYDDCVKYLERGGELGELAFRQRDDLTSLQCSLSWHNELLNKIVVDISDVLHQRDMLKNKLNSLQKVIEHMTTQENHKSVINSLSASAAQLKKEIDEMQHNIDSLEKTKNYVLKHKYLAIKKQFDIEHTEREAQGRYKMPDDETVLGYFPVL